MSSLENGSVHFGFRAICQSAAWRRQLRDGCYVVCPRRAKKKAGGVYDEPSPPSPRR